VHASPALVPYGGAIVDRQQLVAAPPAPPRDPGLFTPDLYPGGPPLVPAAAPALSAAQLRARLEQAVVPAADRLDDPVLRERAPDAAVRVALVSLSATIAAPLLGAFLAGALPVTRVVLGPPAGPGRIVGPPADGAPATRVVNARYRHELPFLFAPSLAHDLLWSGPGAGDTEETTLHAVAAMVHVQLLARLRLDRADLGTELARRQSSLAITLLNSRRPGSADITLVAPDGPGTIPGGAPAMQTPDFWSVPFGPATSASPAEAPPLLTTVLAAVLADGVTLPAPVRYDDKSLEAVFAHPLGRPWFSLDDQYHVASTLGLVP
jgi:hypothetical protein